MGWDQLKNMIDESRQEAREQEEQKHGDITECPECGFKPLEKNRTGECLCPICKWTNASIRS